MNVLIIGQYFPPDLGGAATRAYNAAKGLILNGCDITVVTAFPHYPHGAISAEYKWKPIKKEWMGKIRVIRTFIPPLESKGLARRIILFFSFVISSLFALPFVGKVDVVWAANPDIIAILPAIIYGKIKRVSIVSNVDDLLLEDMYDLNLMSEDSFIAKLAEFVTRMIYEKTIAITPISEGYVNYLNEKYSIEKDKMHVVMGGVDLRTFKPRVVQTCKKEKFMVLYSGAFSMAYDFEQVLKAAKTVEWDDEIEFILQGKGELANQIRSTIGELNIANVKILEKILSREKVADLLRQADVLILPLRDFGKPYLGISSKLYEYQATGKPIICCGYGYPSNYVKKTRSGIIIEPGDDVALAEAVICLKENPRIAQVAGENGRTFAESYLSIEVVGSQMKEIFETLNRENGCRQQIK